MYHNRSRTEPALFRIVSTYQAIMLDAPVAGEIEHGFRAETRGTLVSRTMSASGESRLTSAEQAGGFDPEQA
jgi:hypothetical protein